MSLAALKCRSSARLVFGAVDASGAFARGQDRGLGAALHWMDLLSLRGLRFAGLVFHCGMAWGKHGRNCLWNQRPVRVNVWLLLPVCGVSFSLH